MITGYFSIVSIVLDKDDSPYLVFESLNAKGKLLTQADLIRNYFFMRIHSDQQDAYYQSDWLPMEQALQDSLTEYIRHFLMKEGGVIRQTDVYDALKEKVNKLEAVVYLKELHKYSVYYGRLLDPSLEPDADLQKYLTRLNRIEVTTAYPLLLCLSGLYDRRLLSRDDWIEILKILENFLIRRFIANIASNQLNKIFPRICTQILQAAQDDRLSTFKKSLQSCNYPKDSEFEEYFKKNRLYGAGDRLNKTKLILETLEENYGHKEHVRFDETTIEHVMPQTLSEWWQAHLGADWATTHDKALHTIGNLTLTAYNTEASNGDFLHKKQIYADSHLEINKYFDSVTSWTQKEMDDRADYLGNMALQIWPYFGDQAVATVPNEAESHRPIHLIILGQSFAVRSWRDVLEKTMNTLADTLLPDQFERVAKTCSNYVGKDQNKFRAVRQLHNEYYVEVNLSALGIQTLCQRALAAAQVNQDDWKVRCID